ncbi:MAG: thioredoxin domain-containing protein [Bryobacteraceae bacterium]|jgi:thioredoxin 2
MAFTIVRNCPSCGKGNRIPASHLSAAGRCGACKAALPPIDEPLDVDDNAFNQIVAEASVPILTDFWAAWCGPCRMAAPEVHLLAREMAGRALVLKVNTEENPQVAARFGVQSIPNFVVLRGGRPVFQQAGLVPRAEMRRWLETAQGSNQAVR